MIKAIEPNDNEKYFEWWLDDLMDLGLVIDYEFEPKVFCIADPLPLYVEQNYATKESIIKTKMLYSELAYTPDYKVIFHGALLHKLFGFVKSLSRELLNDPHLTKGNVYQNTLFYLTDVGEIPPPQDDPGGMSNFEAWFEIKPPRAAKNAVRIDEFRYKSRMMFNRYGIIVNKVVPIGSANCLFNKTYIPSRYLYQDNTNSLRRKRNKAGELVPIKDMEDTVLVSEWLKSKGIELGY